MTITTQSADGRLHEFPDGTKPDVIDKAMKEYADQQKSQRGTLAGIGEGFMDPIVGAAQVAEHVMPAPVAKGVNWINNQLSKVGLTKELPLENATDTFARQREAEIAKSRGTEAGNFDWPRFAGNILNPINYIGGGIGPEFKAGMSAAERLAVGMERGEIAGATAGAMEPATDKNFWKEKALQTGTGLAMGAAMGGLFSGASEGLRAIGEHVARNWPENLTSEAVQKILRRIKSGEKSGGPTAAQMIDLVNASSKPRTMADVGSEDVKALAGNVARAPGESRNLAQSFLRKRDEQAAVRLDADISRYLHGGATMFESFKGLLNARSAASRPAYQEAHALEGVWSPRLQQFLDSPDVKKGLARGYEIERNLALAEGRPITATQLGVDLDTEGNIKMIAAPNMRLLDMAKQGLDAMIADARDPFTGRLSAPGVALSKMRQAFVTEMDALDSKGVYKNARQQWAGYSAAIDALKLGQSVFNANPEEFAAAAKELSPANLEFLRIGVADKLREKLLKVGLHGDEAKALIKNEWMRRQLRPAFRSDEDFNKFVDAVAQETGMFETGRKLVGGSQTAERLAEDTAAENPFATALERAFLGPNRGLAVRDAYKIWRDIGFKPSPQLNARIAEILFATDVQPDVATLLRSARTAPKVNPMTGAAGAVVNLPLALAPQATIDLTKERQPAVQ